jgi:hypothetical protein
METERKNRDFFTLTSTRGPSINYIYNLCMSYINAMCYFVNPVSKLAEVSENHKTLCFASGLVDKTFRAYVLKDIPVRRLERCTGNQVWSSIVKRCETPKNGSG